MKVLFISNLFPDAAHPNRGIYNARLVKQLAAGGEVRIIAPRPTRGIGPFWSPEKFSARPEDAAFSPVYPPTAYLPKIGDRWNHNLMARSLRDCLEQTRVEFPFDAVLAAWIYPDACAVAELSREMDFPFVAIAQGSDVHQYLHVPARRNIIVNSLASAKSIVTRSAELGRLLADAGVAKERLHTIYNGVESDIFKPGDKSAARAMLGLAESETVLLYVGNFLPVKNPLRLVDAFKKLCNSHPKKRFRLVMLGEGLLQPDIEQRAKAAGLQELVTLPGRAAPPEVARYMQAADLLCIPSDNEGLPNVMLEAFACGLPVVATPVGGIPEILAEDFLGRLASSNSTADLAVAIAAISTEPAQRERICRHADRFTWQRTAEAYWNLLHRCAS